MKFKNPFISPAKFNIQLIELILAMHGVIISVSYGFGRWFDLKVSSSSYSFDSSYAGRENLGSDCQAVSVVYWPQVESQG